MKIYVALKIARQYEGEFVFVNALKAFIDPINLDVFLKSYQYSPAETINGVECVVEPGVVQVEVGDLDQFFGPHRTATGGQTTLVPELPIQWKNLRKLPEAKIIDGQFPMLGNPEILVWDETGEGKREGRGLVWVEQDNPLVAIDPETLVPTKHYGELRLAQAFNKGRYGPVSLEAAQAGDFRGKEEI